MSLRTVPAWMAISPPPAASSAPRPAARACSGLDGAQTAHALGIAASQSGRDRGKISQSGAKNVAMVAMPTRAPTACLRASSGRGYTLRPRPSRGGWAGRVAMGDEPVLEAVTSGLGERWEIAGNTFKAYPLRHRAPFRNRRLAYSFREKPGFLRQSSWRACLVVGHTLSSGTSRQADLQRARRQGEPPARGSSRVLATEKAD